MPNVDDKFLARLEALLKPHESPLSKIQNWLGVLIPIGVLFIALVTFYVLTNDKLERLEKSQATTEQTALTNYDKFTELKLELERIKSRLDRLEQSKK